MKRWGVGNSLAADVESSRRLSHLVLFFTCGIAG